MARLQIANRNNKKIIEEFLKYFDYVYNTEFPDLTKQQKFFKLNAIKKIIAEIANFPNKITSGSDLKELEGIGKKTMIKIDEILEHGKILETKEVVKNELDSIHGIGINKAREIEKKYNIKTVKELKKLVKEKKIDLPEQILIGLKYHGKILEKIPRNIMVKIDEYLHKQINKVNKNILVTVCGSYRRGKPESGDIDVLLKYNKYDPDNETDAKKEMNKILSKLTVMKENITDPLSTHYMGIIDLDSFGEKKKYARIDIIMCNEDNFYPALLHFTGPGIFNRKMRFKAKKMGYRLSQLGLIKLHKNREEKIKISSEKEIFDILGFEYLEPSERK